MKSGHKEATADDVKILITNGLRLSVREIIELYSIRRGTELFLKELKSTLAFHQYRLKMVKHQHARTKRNTNAGLSRFFPDLPG